MTKTKNVFHVAVIYDEDKNAYEVEVDNQSVGFYKEEKEAQGQADLLSFVYDIGYEQSKRDNNKKVRAGFEYPNEMPNL